MKLDFVKDGLAAFLKLFTTFQEGFANKPWATREAILWILLISLSGVLVYNEFFNKKEGTIIMPLPHSTDHSSTVEPTSESQGLQQY